MNFDEIIDEFRYYGGKFENLEMRPNHFGLGMFAVNSNEKFKLFVPEDLLISPTLIRLNSQKQVVVDEKSGWSKRKREFFENYQKYFGWGFGGFDEILKVQTSLRSLPEELIQNLLILGLRIDSNSKLNHSFCLEKYFFARKILFDGRSMLMPIMEMLNHSENGSPFIIDKGIDCSGFTVSEAFSRYHYTMDSFDFFQLYSFSNEPKIALSCNTSFEISGKKISVRRSSFESYQRKSFLPVKFFRKSTNEIILYDVVLANAVEPKIPVESFSKLCEEYSLDRYIAEDIFNGLINHNVKVLNNCLKVIEVENFDLRDVIEDMVKKQLAIIQANSQV